MAGTAPRSAALRILLALHGGAIDDLAGWPPADSPLAPRDAALARELALGACTHARLYDWLADLFLRPGEQPPPLRLALRVTAHQLFALDRVPPHAAVACTAAMLREADAPHLAAVGNAVARRLSDLRLPERLGPGPLGRLHPGDHPADAAVRHSLPQTLLDDLAATVPPGDESALAALNLRPHLCTRTRPGAPSPSGASILRRDGPWTWWGDPHEALHGPVADGRCVVQDRSQGRVADLVLGTARARHGDLVLDLCASPGGKALALRDAGLTVIAADRNLAKAAAMPASLPRLVSDGLAPALAGGFEVVLVDAPCSNSGVFGRRPEARLRYDIRHRDRLVDLQRRLLASASGLVAPGGRLVYATCSVAPPENQGMAHHLPGWRLLGEHTAWPDAWQGGGYCAVLLRT